MQVRRSVHAIKMPFSSNPASKGAADRFVYAYLIIGREICLIDSGVRSSYPVLADYLLGLGRRVEEIGTLVLTHSHPDHIGGGPLVVEASRCRVAAHREATPLIEDVELQYSKRPTATFRELVAGPIRVTQPVGDGDRIPLGDGTALEVLHTPGHSAGSISIWHAAEKVLFSGDAVPKYGDRPLWEAPAPLVQSLDRLQGIPGVEVLCSSWHDPIFGAEIQAAFAQGRRCLEEVDEAAGRVLARNPAADPEALCTALLEDLKLPDLPNVRATLRAHLRAGHSGSPSPAEPAPRSIGDHQ